MARPRPLLDVATSSKIMNMSPKRFLRWARDRMADRDPDTGKLRWPDLLQSRGRTILVQATSLANAAGNPSLIVEAEIGEAVDRITRLEHRADRVDGKLAELMAAS